MLRDPIYGRLSPLHMFHADQSPCELTMPGTCTLNIFGTPCWQPGSGLDKRFITIHLSIRPGGRQIFKPILIFRGQGLQITQAERDQLNVLQALRWYFQPKAWAGTEFCLWSLASFKADLLEAGILDDLQSQHNQVFLNAAVAANVLPFYTPPDCTDVAAPCDDHVFVRMKKLIKNFYRAVSDVNREEWAESSDSNSLSASRRRTMLAQWVNEALKLLCEGSESEAFCMSAFTSTGFLMKLADPSIDFSFVYLLSLF